MIRRRTEQPADVVCLIGSGSATAGISAFAELNRGTASDAVCKWFLGHTEARPIRKSLLGEDNAAVALGAVDGHAVVVWGSESMIRLLDAPSWARLSEGCDPVPGWGEDHCEERAEGVTSLAWEWR